jgi:hypothetical protein
MNLAAKTPAEQIAPLTKTLAPTLTTAPRRHLPAFPRGFLIDNENK